MFRLHPSFFVRVQSQKQHLFLQHFISQQRLATLNFFLLASIIIIQLYFMFQHQRRLLWTVVARCKASVPLAHCGLNASLHYYFIDLAFSSVKNRKIKHLVLESASCLWFGERTVTVKKLNGLFPLCEEIYINNWFVTRAWPGQRHMDMTLIQ